MKLLAIRGVEIAYLDEGKGPAVIAGHCSSASHNEWLPLIEALKSDWRVLAPDFIGYGQSEPWPATEPFSIDPTSRCCARSPRKRKARSISSAILTAPRSRSKRRTVSASA
jgi:pimeloyl-ACP methyl ester carboxylesterase